MKRILQNNTCKFCNLDTNNIYNTIIDETENFIVIPAVGALVDGYVLIVSKKHLYNIFLSNNKIIDEYYNLIQKYRNKFKTVYGKYPIIFEHGTGKNEEIKSASSIVHAHTHIVNHNFKKEEKIIKMLNLTENNKINSNLSYILYISPHNKKYITYNFEPTSQLMRLLIAKELSIKNKYNWKKDVFENNIISTIKNMKNN